MHYFAWALLLPYLHNFVALYFLATHFLQSIAFGPLFSTTYSAFYFLMFMLARVDPIFHGSTAYCLLAWLGVGVVQFVVGHKVIQGEFPRNKAPMSKFYRIIGVIYETMFGMAMLFRLLYLRLGLNRGHSHSHDAQGRCIDPSTQTTSSSDQKTK
jgi:hypothetical protein